MKCPHCAKVFAVGRRGWTEEEDNFLCQNYGLKTARWVGEQLGRTHRAVEQRAERLGAQVRKNQPWTEQEDAILRANWPSLGSACQALLPGRSKSNMAQRAVTLGVRNRVSATAPRRPEASFGHLPMGRASSVFDLAKETT